MYKIVIIEDEFNAQEALSKMLKLLFKSVEVVGTFPSINEGVSFLENREDIDLIFLDVELEDGNSFELLQQLSTIHFKIIFTTGLANYAIDAIKHNAVDYLLKPIDPLELKEAVNKAIHQINEEKKAKTIISQFEESQKEKENKIIIKTADNTHFLEVGKIIMFESDGAYTKVVCEEQTILASKHLKYFENLPELEKFIRVHHSFLINPTHVINIAKSAITMTGNTIAKVSTRKYTQVVQQLKTVV